MISRLRNILELI